MKTSDGTHKSPRLSWEGRQRRIGREELRENGEACRAIAQGMRYILFHLALATLGAMLWCQGARGQGFNKRYDAFGQGFEQGAWDIERSGTDYLVISASYEPDTVAPDSILGLYRIIMQWIDGQGNLLQEKRHKVPFHSLYPGWADCCDSVEGGGMCLLVPWPAWTLIASI